MIVDLAGNKARHYCYLCTTEYVVVVLPELFLSKVVLKATEVAQEPLDNVRVLLPLCWWSGNNCPSSTTQETMDFAS